MLTIATTLKWLQRNDGNSFITFTIWEYGFLTISLLHFTYSSELQVFYKCGREIECSMQANLMY